MPRIDADILAGGMRGYGFQRARSIGGEEGHEHHDKPGGFSLVVVVRPSRRVLTSWPTPWTHHRLQPQIPEGVPSQRERTEEAEERRE